MIVILLSTAPDICAMSIDEESKLGDEVLTIIKKEAPLIDDDFVNNYITGLGNHLLQYQDSKPFSLNFYVIKDSTLNAFAIPGGHIFFYAGLINIMDQADEFASIVSHEEGHVEARHYSSRVD